MLREEDLATALSLERELYQALSETASLTVDLAEAVGRQDSESIRLFLKMRQEQIDRMVEQDTALHRLCGTVLEGDAPRLRELLEGRAEAVTAQEQPLFQQVARNRNLLERVRQSDRSVSQRLGNENSFYQRKGR